MKALLLERHEWETSGSQTQVQIPKGAFGAFFEADGTINITVHVFSPPTSSHPQSVDAQVSYYEDSDTYRFNMIADLGALGHAILVLEETEAAGTYNLWWFLDADAEAMLQRPYPWQQAKGSQYGPGRHWALIDAPGPKTL